jgi:tRNA threonylcarbamoyladenosine biosynthesis protein TsaB
MTVLGIESATAVCAAAVVSGGSFRSGRSIEGKHLHAEHLMSIIDGSLRDAGLSVRDLRAIAVSIGPGSFTGLRIGLSVAKGLACAAGKPVIPVPTLTSLARHAARAGIAGNHSRILPVLDARRDEVYCQLFERVGASVLPVWEERDMTLAGLVDLLGREPALVTGEAAVRVRAALEGRDVRSRPACLFAPPEIARCDAGTVAMIGAELAAEGLQVDLDDLEPRYIKEFFLRTTH